MPVKREPKEIVGEGTIKEDYGLICDAYADCCTNRQISLANEVFTLVRKLMHRSEAFKATGGVHCNHLESKE